MSGSAPSSSGLQAAAAVGSGILPQTGVAAGMLLWAILGLAMLLLGLVLVAIQRQEPAGRRREARFAPAR